MKWYILSWTHGPYKYIPVQYISYITTAQSAIERNTSFISYFICHVINAKKSIQYPHKVISPKENVRFICADSDFWQIYSTGA